VADAFDAMTSTRSYRSSLALRSAVHEIERNAGRMFDPLAVKAFLRLVAQGEIEADSSMNEVPRQTVARERLAV
jgi:HD-GYP domain-containing protein (c-di-GMP phosphodiesterase class II)